MVDNLNKILVGFIPFNPSPLSLHIKSIRLHRERDRTLTPPSFSPPRQQILHFSPFQTSR
jgi:hypothetical protein